LIAGSGIELVELAVDGAVHPRPLHRVR